MSRVGLPYDPLRFILRISDLCSLVSVCSGEFGATSSGHLGPVIQSVEFKAPTRPTDEPLRYDPQRSTWRFCDFGVLVAVCRVRARSVALGVYSVPAFPSAEFNVLTRKTDEPCVQRSICATIQVWPMPYSLVVHLEPAVPSAELNALGSTTYEPRIKMRVCARPAAVRHASFYRNAHPLEVLQKHASRSCY